MKQRYFTQFAFSFEFNCYVDTYKKRVKASEYLVWAYIFPNLLIIIASNPHKFSHFSSP